MAWARLGRLNAVQLQTLTATCGAKRAPQAMPTWAQMGQRTVVQTQTLFAKSAVGQRRRAAALRQGDAAGAHVPAGFAGPAGACRLEAVRCSRADPAVGPDPYATALDRSCCGGQQARRSGRSRGSCTCGRHGRCWRGCGCFEREESRFGHWLRQVLPALGRCRGTARQPHAWECSRGRRRRRRCKRCRRGYGCCAWGHGHLWPPLRQGAPAAGQCCRAGQQPWARGRC